MNIQKAGARTRLGAWGGKLGAAVLTAAALSITATAGVAEERSYDDGLLNSYYEAAKGKTVAFVPIAMSFDITQGYAAGMQRQADKLGYELVIRDPNFSVEQAVQAIDQLIVEKPDVIIAHPLDAAAFNRLAIKAQKAGIYWIWANLKGGPNGDGYVGGNHYETGVVETRLAAEACADSESKKIALITAPPTNSVTIASNAGIQDELKNHPDLKVVATQSADSDAGKARAIASTVLKQHPDLCAIIGQWDGTDIAIPSAVEEAGLTGKVAVITQGGGSKATACDKVADGSFYAFVSYDVGAQTQDLNNLILQLLQAKPEPASQPVALYMNPKVLTKDSLAYTSCWTVEDLSRPLD
ncbi:sugar ABC transporter substrate-binding protein [Celeribacter litoreus]|uniref:sugar ABC transporter substrate-binding protein n=1 Tax=Celeribacter litoreus TaxID=2876714 RepID=UPI001CC94103|nr:sugar ABC transporter substrate-binding protein [Celeribacter litoreus]MCA0043402.1 sugar ABC transporter substrate-binding protein [Celeribacter litoreus]